MQKGSETEMSYRKWTPVPRKVKAKEGGNDDEGDDEDHDAAQTEKWCKEMLPCTSSRPDFTSLYLKSMPVPSLGARPLPCRPPPSAPHTRCRPQAHPTRATHTLHASAGVCAPP